jgi:hypothetical protein
MFRDRAHQFVHRLNWAIGVSEDEAEIDQFDDDTARYLVQEDVFGHVASMRVRSMEAPNLISHVFPHFRPFLFRDGVPSCEMTRFVRTPRKVPWDGGKFLDWCHTVTVHGFGFRRAYGLYTKPMLRVYRAMDHNPTTLAEQDGIMLGFWPAR